MEVDDTEVEEIQVVEVDTKVEVIEVDEVVHLAEVVDTKDEEINFKNKKRESYDSLFLFF